jgi:hypothetical protein
MTKLEIKLLWSIWRNKPGKIQHITVHRKIIDKSSFSRLRPANWQLNNNTSLFDNNENGNTAAGTAVLITKWPPTSQHVSRSK